MADPFVLADSPHIAASGAATTAQLSAPGGGFTAGRIQDDENPADAVDIGADGYTELEWAIQATADAASAATYEFRVTKAGVPLDTYTVTPQWTILSMSLLFPPRHPMAHMWVR
jgi:hypothetical protein